MKGIITWAAPKPTEFNGKRKVGIKIEGHNGFLDCFENPDENVKILKKGNEIEFIKELTTISDIKLIKEAEVKPEYNKKSYNGPRKVKDEPWLKQQGVYNLASTQVIELLKLQKPKEITLEEIHNLTVVRAREIYRCFRNEELSR